MADGTRLQKLERMLEADPSDQTLRYMIAMELDKQGYSERALEFLEGLMVDHAPYVPAFLMAGQQMARLGRINEAKKCYQLGIAEAQRQGNAHAAGEMAGFLNELPGSGVSQEL